MGSTHQYVGMQRRVFLPKLRQGKHASGEDILRFEALAVYNLREGREVFTIEPFPKRYFYYLSKIRLEKVVERDPTLDDASNAQLFRVVLTGNIYE